MSAYALSHLPDAALLRRVSELAARDRALTAELLAHLAEVDARKLYLPAAYPSMFAWCVGELGLSEDAAFRRIRAARTARQYPVIFPALAEGRLSLSAVLVLTPYLTPANARELLAAAAGRTKPGLERLIAGRFPRPDVPSPVPALGDDPYGAATARGTRDLVACVPARWRQRARPGRRPPGREPAISRLNWRRRQLACPPRDLPGARHVVLRPNWRQRQLARPPAHPGRETA